MKWIGQHIWSLISRFRNDVYLESVTESAQDHVVGIDADGKLYKQDVSTGDITGVTITTDSGGGSAATDTSGSADFSILGSSGVDVTNSGTTITATAVPAEIDHDSLNNFVANEHIDWTADQGATNIHSGNYTNTTYTSSDFDHNSLTNYVAAEHYRWDNDNSGTATIHANNITDLHGAGVDGSANQLLTDDGDGSVTSEASLTYDSEILTIGNDDNGFANVTRAAHSDGGGGALWVSAGSATNGQTNQTGGHLYLRAGAATGNAAAGNIVFFTSPPGGSGTSLQAHRDIASLGSSSGIPTFTLNEAPGSSSDFFRITTTANGATTISTTDAAGTDAFLNITPDGNFAVSASGTAGVAGTDITLDASNNIELNADGGQVIFTDDTAVLGKITSDGLDLTDNAGAGIIFEGTTDDAHQTALSAGEPTGDRTVTLPDTTGTVQLQGEAAGKQLQVFVANFYDDIGTTKHYIPLKDVNEQTTIYQDEVAMHAVCDGRIVSVSVSPHNVSSAGNLTIGIHTRNVGVSMTASASNWTDQETETIAVDGSGGDDDNHTFHFAFDNAKHFDSTNKVSISIQSDSDLGSSSFWYATVVVEWDWTTFLGSTSAELNSTP